MNVTRAKHGTCANIGQRNARKVVFEKLKGRHKLRHLVMEGMIIMIKSNINLLKPTGHVMHQQFNIQQLYALPTLRDAPTV